MKNTTKITLGFAVAGILLFITRAMMQVRTKNKYYIAPDGNRYFEDAMYRTSKGEIYKNGRLMHFKTPELLSEAHTQIDSDLYKDDFVKNVPSFKNIFYHKRGVRHQ